jgi:flagellar capping protein FliD
MGQSNISSMLVYLRGQRVILDFNLAILYDVETRTLKQAVRRNIDRFPADFMFELRPEEWENLRSQFVISSLEHGGIRYLPMAFTEQGVAMLSSVLKSKKAIMVNITIMRAFVKMRDMLDHHKELKKQLEDLEAKYDHQFAEVFAAIRELVHQENQPRNPIGFKLNQTQ